MTKRKFKKYPSDDGRFRIAGLLIIIIAGLIVYSNALKCGFVWDDQYLIKENPSVRSLIPSIKTIFTSDILAGTAKESIYYRPIQIISYALDHIAWGMKPVGYHLTNIIIHILNALLVALLVRRLTNNDLISFTSSLLFVVHPVQAAVVTYCSGRADSLALFFILAGLIFFIKHITDEKPGSFWVWSVFSYILAILSKELALVFPFLALLFTMTYGRDVRRSPRGLIVFLFLITLIYVALRFTLLNFGFTRGFDLFYTVPNILMRCDIAVKAFSLYIWLLIAPVDLQMQRELYGISQVFSYMLYASCAVFILVIVWALRRARPEDVIRFSIGLFLITILPLLNIALPLVAEMAEHWLYLPSIGWFIFISTMAVTRVQRYYLRSMTALAGAIFGVLVITYGIMTFNYNKVWTDEFALYQHILSRRPNDVKMRINLAGAHADCGDYGRAIAEYKTAIQTAPRMAELYYNLADAYYKTGNKRMAIIEYTTAISLNPRYVEAYNNLGNIYDEIKQPERAVKFFEKSIMISPNYVAYNSMGISMFNMKRYDESIYAYSRALELEASSVNTMTNLGNAYFAKGDIENAKRAWRAALKKAPDNELLRQNLKLLGENI